MPKVTLVSERPLEWDVRSYDSLVKEPCSECGQPMTNPLEKLGREAANHLWNNSAAEFQGALYLELKRLRASYRSR